MKKTIHVKEYTRKRHGRAKFGGEVSSHDKSGRALTPFRRMEAKAKVLRGNGTYHKMMEDEALHKLEGDSQSKSNFDTRVVYKAMQDNKHWTDNELWFPSHEAAFEWASKATKSPYFKDIFIE